VRSVKETLHELSQKTSQITDDELKKLKARLPHLKDSDWKEIETMAKRLGAKVLQDPMVELKSRAKEDSETESVLAFFRSLFRI
jgi:glutamyl-tRNA reductase